MIFLEGVFLLRDNHHIAKMIILFNMKENIYKKQPLFNRTYLSPSHSHHEIQYAKSQPNQFTNRMRRAKNIFQHMITEMPPRSSSYSFAHKEHRSDQEKSGSTEKNLARLCDKAIIHDSFSNYLAKNYKTFRIGINTIAIKKKLKFQKDGVGQLACNIAQAKPINFKAKVEPEAIDRKAYFRQMRRSRNECSQLNEWSKKLQILQRVHTNRLIDPKKQQLPGIKNRKKRKQKNEHLKPWSIVDQPRFANLYTAIKTSNYDFYEIID